MLPHVYSRTLLFQLLTIHLISMCKFSFVAQEKVVCLFVWGLSVFVYLLFLINLSIILLPISESSVPKSLSKFLMYVALENT